jgi:hypothetical protein
MRDFIKNKLHNTLMVNQQVDYNLNNPHNDNLKETCICNQMNINDYEQGMELLNKVLGSKTQNPEDWGKITKPLEMWATATNQIRSELGEGMTGDSEVDESDSWWHGIQNAFCK